jgi:hypothetical protein
VRTQRRQFIGCAHRKTAVYWMCAQKDGSLLDVRTQQNSLILSVSIPLCLYYCIGSIYLLPSTQQTVGYNGFITTCFDPHESSSGYVQSFTPGGSESYTRTEGHPTLHTDSQPPEQGTIRSNPRRSSDTSLRAQKPSAPVFICLEDTLHNNFKMRENNA